MSRATLDAIAKRESAKKPAPVTAASRKPKKAAKADPTDVPEPHE